MNTENNNLEELYRQHLVEQEPPADAWQRIEQRMAASPHEGGKGGRKAWIAAAVVAMVAVVAGVFAMLTKDELPAVAESAATESPMMPVAAESAGEWCAASPAENQIPQKKDATLSANCKGGKTAQPAVTATAHNTEPTVSQGQQTALVETHADVTHNASQKSGAEVAAQYQPKESPKDGKQSTAVQVSDTTAKLTIRPDTAADGQQSTDEKQSILIPNLLTPNGDGYNDVWHIIGTEPYRNVEVRIYTASSKLVYQNSDYRNDFTGEGLPEGNYFYMVQIRAIHFTQRGVLLIKKQ